MTHRELPRKAREGRAWAAALLIATSIIAYITLNLPALADPVIELWKALGR